jgi:hypothetical protein
MRLTIATGTAKADVHHVSGELEVNGCTEALVRARELDLL